VADFLAGRDETAEYLEAVAARGEAYGGFNLLVADGRALGYHSNRGSTGPHILAAGIHAVSNHLLETPWPKLQRVRERFAAALAAEQVPAPETLFGLLADTEPAADGDLPDTGLGVERERLLSAPFVLDPQYGTRCSTLAWLPEAGASRAGRLMEREFDRGGRTVTTRDFRFTLERVPASG
jgi:uncharacterized protein with NRDE domain